MHIDKHNYGAYILDYFEGTLSAAQQEELLSFLSSHPGFKKEFDEYEHFSLEARGNENIFFEEKNLLKKNISITDEKFFGYIDGHLGDTEKKDIEKTVKGNKVLEKELVLWRNARIEPDFSVVYPAKEELKHRPVVIALWQNVYLRAAAVITLALSAGWIYFATGKNADNEILASAGKSPVEKFVAAKFFNQSQRFVPNEIMAPANNNNLLANSFLKSKNKKGSQHNFILKNNTVRNEIVNSLTKDSADPKFIAEIELPEKQFEKNVNEELHKKTVAGTWEPEEVLPPARKGFKQKFLDIAVSCLNGLKKVGVKKAGGIKKEDPQNGITDYTLVLGKRSYSISQ